MSINGQHPELALLTDLYQLNMAYAHFRHGTHQTRVTCDLFFRTNPFGGGFAVAAGLDTALDYLESLRFSETDLAYLAGLDVYGQDFLDHLAGFSFHGDVAAIPEGTAVFPNLPLMRVTADILTSHLVETALTNIVGHQTLIATKAARIAAAAAPGRVLEFGLRRAHGPDAGILGTRASIIGGCEASSNVLAGKAFHSQVAGTHAHAWVQFWDDEQEAFRRWAEAMPNAALFLVDTYDTLKSGLPNALAVGRELEAAGGRFAGIRLDSGDLAYLSKRAREMMDEAGFPNAIIVASSDLDEHVIRDLQHQGARIDYWGVGTNLITAHDSPALGCVYKLAAIEDQGCWRPRLKISDNPEKVSNPGRKRAVRIIERATGKAAADVIMLESESVPEGESITLFDPVHPWKRKRVEGFDCRDLLIPVYEPGRRVFRSPSLRQLQQDCRDSLDELWEEYRRLLNPEPYPVDLSPELWQLKRSMIHQLRAGFDQDE